MKQFKHKRSTIIVEYNPNNYYQQTTNPNMKYAQVVVEGSDDWEEIIPLVDFHGKNLNRLLLHYKVLLLSDNTTAVWNGLNFLPASTSKTLAVFQGYEEACEFQKVYNAIKKFDQLLISPRGNATEYFKRLLKVI